MTQRTALSPSSRPGMPFFGYAAPVVGDERDGDGGNVAERVASELQRELSLGVYRALMRYRFLIAPIPLLLGSIVVALDPTPWRRVVIVVLLTTAVVLGTLEQRAVNRGHKTELDTPLAVVAAIQACVVFATGGVASPVVLPMLLIGFVASTQLARPRARAIVAGEIAAVWVAAAVELSGVVGTLLPLPFRSAPAAGPAPLLVFALLLVETMIFLVALEAGSRTRHAFSELLERITAARDEALRTHAERLEELTRLAGEIAHELKNPLASIKGLAALLARQSDGTEGEHLAVLRAEADRMQATLDDFLNLSRPLVPLTLRDTDLGALVAEVCTLHEGQLAQRRLHLAAVPRPGMTATVRADPRKVQQILVNLLQNAIEASPEGGAIELRLTASEAGVQVTIADAGPGLAPGLRGRAFERGMTTKPKGSGIGLEVARGLARQHGGDVTLESPAGRGCEATLALPWVAAVGAGGALSGEGASRTEEGTP